MIDCHTHLLPNLDDGSSDIENSINALKQMAEGGITSAICTTHYMRGHYQYTNADYNAAFRELEAELKHQEIPILIFPGAEVYISNGISEDIVKNKLTLAESNYVLIETDLNKFPPDFHKNIYDLLRRGFKPILAHAERYVSIMNKTHETKELLNRNIYIQVNAASIIGGYGDKVKETVWKMLNKGWVHFLGSDHHSKSNYTAYFKAKEKIIEHIDEKTATLLTKTHPQTILDNGKLLYDYVIVHKAPKVRYNRLKLFKSLGL